MKRERDYLERTIATVRNHRDADNCWPQWANIFADEIERLWQIEDAASSVSAETATEEKAVSEETLRKLSAKGKVPLGTPCPQCGCESWARTKALRQICGYCAWPDARPEEPGT